MNSKFKFRLQHVLELRNDEEQELKNKFSLLQKDKSDIENRIEQLKLNYKKYYADSPNLDLISQKITNNYLISLEDSIALEGNELEKKVKEIESTRKNLIDKQIEKKSIENLRLKREREFLEIEKIKEQQLLDEISIISYIRKKIV